MNTKPIENARDADIRLSLVALRRAAQRAQALARDSGLPLVISRNGLVEYAPLQPEQPLILQEPSGLYGDKKQ
jgi:hypothetical protein